MIDEWNAKKRLSKMGFAFDPNTLTDFDVACFTLISAKIEELEEAKLERDMKKHGNNKN